MDRGGPDVVNRWRWLGLSGSALVAVAGFGAGALPRPNPLSDIPVLRLLSHGAGPKVCIALAAIGMAALVWSWWRLRPGGGAAPGVRWLTVTAAWWALPLALAPPLFSRDLYSYAGDGLVVTRGLDPYQVGPAVINSGLGADWLASQSTTWAHTPAPYGPLFLLVCGRAVDASGGHLLVAVGLIRAAAVLGMVALALVTPRLAAAYGGNPAWAQWLLAANPFLLAHLVAGGHNEALMLPPLAAALLVAAPRSGQAPRRVLALGVAAGALLGLAATVKVSALVAMPFVALLIAAGLPAVSGRWPYWFRLGRATAVVGGGALTVYTLLALAAGVGIGFVHALQVTAGVTIQWTSIPTGWGLAAAWVAAELGHPAAKLGLLGIARSIGTLLGGTALIGIWWQVRRPKAQVGGGQVSPGQVGGREFSSDETARYAATLLAACGVGLLILVMLGEAVHPWYLCWGLLPLAAIAGPETPTGLPIQARLGIRLGILCAVLCFFVLPDGYSIARATVVPGTLFDLALTLAAGWYGVRWLRARGRLVAGG